MRLVVDLGCGNSIAQIWRKWNYVLTSVYGSSVVQNWSTVLWNWFGASQIGLFGRQLVNVVSLAKQNPIMQNYSASHPKLVQYD